MRTGGDGRRYFGRHSPIARRIAANRSPSKNAIRSCASRRSSWLRDAFRVEFSDECFSPGRSGSVAVQSGLGIVHSQGRIEARTRTVGPSMVLEVKRIERISDGLTGVDAVTAGHVYARRGRVAELRIFRLKPSASSCGLAAILKFGQLAHERFILSSSLTSSPVGALACTVRRTKLARTYGSGIGAVRLIAMALMASSFPALAQLDSLALVSGTVPLYLNLTSPSGSEPATVQWTLTYPAGPWRPSQRVPERLRPMPPRLSVAMLPRALTRAWFGA